MSNPFVAEIRIFGFNFAPKGWATCTGQLLPISQFTALFSLLGTTYGGDGKATFALPDMRDNVPMFWGQGPGLSLHDEGETSGTPTVTLLTTEMPQHTHTLSASNADSTDQQPGANLNAGGIGVQQYAPAGSIVQFSPNTIAVAGGSQPHNNLMPYLSMLYCIAMQGVFPPRQ